MYLFEAYFLVETSAYLWGVSETRVVTMVTLCDPNARVKTLCPSVTLIPSLLSFAPPPHTHIYNFTFSTHSCFAQGRQIHKRRGDNWER